MATFKGTYKQFLQGVSQQIPQEREDGQLGEQINMLSDIVNGLRRRSGVKMYATIADIAPESYIRLIELSGEYFVVIVDPIAGKVVTYNLSTGELSGITEDYFQATSKLAIKTTVSRDTLFILNTEKIPTKTELSNTRTNPNRMGYFSVRSSAFSKTFYFTVNHPSLTDGQITFTVTTSASTAATATPEYVATQLAEKMAADSAFAALFTIQRDGTTVAIKVTSDANTGLTVCSSSTGNSYVWESGASRVSTRTDLLGVLPTLLDGYIMAVGNVGNSAYYEYDSTKRLWSETSIYEGSYYISNTPFTMFLDSLGGVAFDQLTIEPRGAGDDDNNPEPKFIGYGLTGIGSYQSRLVLLSGSYVNLSRTTDFGQFMRTSVTELLDDDAIEISSASLSSAQFEYCVPYNKDLVLIAQTQQAVIPANNTVLTPRTAVIYPSTNVDLSLACEPTPVGRSLYYVSQRGVDNFQVGEFIPNTYTDAQYYSQNLMDHVPLYATGVCTHMAASTTNNMAVFTSDSNEVLINQYLWQGDARAQLAFHKWVLPLPVIHAEFLQDTLLLFMEFSGGLIIGTIDFRQSLATSTSTVPYLDLYTELPVATGVPFDVPVYLQSNSECTTVVLDDPNLRHYDLIPTIDGTTGTVQYDGTVAIGAKYMSSYTLTPPFIKDDAGNIVAGSDSNIVRFDMEFKGTGKFDVSVQDSYGVAYDGIDNTALTWSETQLGYTPLNGVGSIAIPCRTRLSSTKCVVSTNGTTELNLIRCSYLLRINNRYRRL